MSHPAHIEEVSSGAELLEGLGLALGALAPGVLGEPVSAEAMTAALREARRAPDRGGRPGWAVALESAAASLGMRTRWIHVDIEEVAALARPDLPLLTFTASREVGGRWISAAGRSLGRVQIRQHGAPFGARWMLPERAAALLLIAPSSRPHSWAILEPAAPAQSMSSSSTTALGRAASLLRQEREAIWGIALYSAAVGLLTLATPLTIQVLINWLSFGALQQPLLVLSLGLLMSLSLAALLRGLMRLAAEMLQRRIFVRTVLDLAWRLPRVKVAAYDRAYGPELVNRFFDVLTVQKAVGALFLDGLGAALGAAVGMTLLAFYHPVLLGFALALSMGAAFILFVLGRGAEASAIKESKSKYRVAGWLEELARQPLVFKLGGADIGLTRADGLSREYLSYRQGHFRVFFRQYAGSLAMQVLASAALLGLCGWLVLDGGLSIGQLVAAEFIVTSALLNFVKLTEKLESFYDLLAAADKLGSLIDLPVEAPRGAWTPQGGGGAGVEAEGISFRYPGSPPVLQDIALSVLPGERVAVVGTDASGKSTLAELLLGVRTPDSGAVRRDGSDLRSLRPQRYLEEAALMRAEEVILGTVEDNIALGRPGVDTAAVMRAVRAAGLGSAVDALEDGLHAPLTPGSNQLSSAAQRRLLLARTLAGQPRLIVVDGWLDRCGPEMDEMISALVDPDQTWTLIVFTEQEHVAARLKRRLELAGGRLHERQE